MHFYSVTIHLTEQNCIMPSVIVPMYLTSTKLNTDNLSKAFDAVNTAVIIEASSRENKSFLTQ